MCKIGFHRGGGQLLRRCVNSVETNQADSVACYDGMLSKYLSNLLALRSEVPSNFASLYRYVP